MGKLRKIGKKIKKGLKKVLGSKLGKIVGGIGLAMMFWSGANALFSKSQWWNGFKESVSSMNPFASQSGVDAVNKVAPKLDTSLAVDATSSETLKAEALAGAAESVKTGIGSESTRTLTDIPFSELDVGQKISKVGAEAKDFFIPEGSMDNFVPDVAKSITGTVAVQSLLGEESGEEFFGGSVAGQPQNEAAQGAFVAEVRNQIPAIPATNFQQLNQSLLYGTLSPQYLMGQMS